MRNFSSAYGASKDKFGHADYYEALKIGTPSEVVSYLSENQGIMGDMNKRGSGGLYDQVLTEAMSRNVGTINALRGNSPYNFGDADYEAAKSIGFTDEQIKGYLDKNQNRLYSGNRPEAAGGLYNRILQGIKNTPDPMAELQTTVDRQKSEFQNQLKIMQDRQVASEQEFKRQAQLQQEQFDTAQRTTLSNQARSGQQADYRLGSASRAMKGGTAGFRRRPRSTFPQISASGFTTENAMQNKGTTLNV
jgi:hypothetical protein